MHVRLPVFVRDEWPTLLGLALGLVAMYIAIGDQGSLPTGSDWGEYVRSADYIWHRSGGAHYTDWRRPLYPYLLGLGALVTGSYTQSGVWLATASVYSLVFSAGIAARALAGRWATLPAAVALVSCAPALVAARWVNLYPLQAGLFGAAFAFGAVAMRRGSPAFALLSGSAAGLSAVVDGRGALAIPVAAALVLGGARRPLQTLALVFAFTTPIVAITYAETAAIAAWRVPQLSFERQIQGQHDMTTTSSGAMAFDNDVTRQCAAGQGRKLEPEALFGACTEVVRTANLRSLAASRAFPSPAWFSLGILLFVPRRGQLRIWAATLLAYTGLAVAVGLGLGLAAWPERYGLAYIVPIVVLAPLVIEGVLQGVMPGEAAKPGGGVCGSLGPRAALLALCVTLGGFQPAPVSAMPPGGSPRDRAAQLIAERVSNEVPADMSLLDCTDYSMDLFRLPAARNAPTPAFDIAAACKLASFPAPAPQWLVLGGATIPDATTNGYRLVADEGGSDADRMTVWTLAAP